MIDFELKDNLSKDLQKMVRGIRNREPFYRIWGGRVKDESRRNARSKGGKTFWRQIAGSIQVDEVDSTHAIVGVHHVAGAQKEFGGRITAKRAKYLTIPIHEDSKRKRAGEFTMPLFVRREKGKEPDDKGKAILGYASGGKFVGLYLLKRAVEQKPDPYMPTEEELLNIGVEEAIHRLDKEIAT